MQVVFSPGAEIKFEGANNFRELGGYRAADVRQVKYGLLYRGGNLDLLKSEADHARLASLGLREILDLRSAGESAAHPDPAVPGAHYQRVCGMRNADGTEMDFSGQGIERLRQEKKAFERSVGRPVHDFEWFSALYREMPFRNPAYHALFALLEGRRVPVLFHCSCGKDRTGIGAMLILLALGVSRADALADYMLTNVYRRETLSASWRISPPPSAICCCPSRASASRWAQEPSTKFCGATRAMRRTLPMNSALTPQG